MFLIFLLAFGLSIDAFAVSISLNLSKSINHKRDKFKVALSFGFFQALMPIIGYMLVLPFIENYGYVIKSISFILLTFLGIKMIYETMTKKDDCINSTCIGGACDLKVCQKTKKSKRLLFKDLIIFSIATSIDALLAGLVIQSFSTPLVSSVIIIFVMTFVLSYIGANLKVVSSKFEKSTEVVGGFYTYNISNFSNCIKK